MIINFSKLIIIKRTLPPAATPIHFKDIINGLKGLLRGQKEITRFETELKNHYNIKHCFLVSSGKAALTIILKALHDLHPERDEVLIPAYTCYSVPSAIIKAGLKIKLCDINPETLDFDYNQLTKMFINSKFKIKNSKLKKDNILNSKLKTKNSKLIKTSLLAVLPTHLFGIPSDIDKLRKVVNEKEVFILEDVAQAMGTTIKDKQLGTLGDIGFFSLGRGKAFSTIEGGIILTNNNNIAKKITTQMKTIKSYNILEIIKLIVSSIILTVFMHPTLFWFPKALPFLKLGETLFEQDFPIKKLSPFQAGLARNWQIKLSELTKTRTKNTIYWINHINSKLKIKNSKLKLDNFPNSKLKTKNSKLSLPLLRFPIKINNPKTLKNILSKSETQGLGIMRAYPDSINNIKQLKQHFKTKNSKLKTKNSKLISQQLLTLPVHNFVSLSDSLKIKKLIHNELYS